MTIKKKKVLTIIIIIIILTSTIAIAMGLIIFFKKPKIENPQKPIDLKVDYNYSNFLSCDNDGKLKLYKADGLILNELNLKNIDAESDDYNIDGTFKLYKMSNGEIIVKDEVRNILFTIEIKENKIKPLNIIKGLDFNTMTEIDKNENSIYFIFENKNEIKELRNKNAIKNYILLETPYKIYAEQNKIYYTTEDKLGMIEKDNYKTHKIIVGDKTKEIFLYNSKLYLLSEFGKNIGNLAFMKINALSLYVDDIIKIGGNLIGINKEKSYFEKDNFIYECNLNDMSVVEVCENEEKLPVKQVNDLFYFFEKDRIIIKTIKDNETVREINLRVNKDNFIFL